MRGSLVLLGLFIGILTAPAAAKEPSKVQPHGQLTADNSRARELFRLGTNAYKAGREEEARQLLTEAWELHQSYDIAAILGQVEFELGHAVRANELLDFCLQNFPPIESDEKLAKMRKVRELARMQVTELEPNCDCSGAVLYLDEIEVGSLPLLLPLYVAPGRHRVTVRKGGLETKASVEAKAGQRQTVDLELKEPTKPAMAPASRPLPVQTDKSEGGAPLWPIYVGGGLVALNVAAAIGFKVASNGAGDRATALRAKLSDPQNGCSPTATPSTSAGLICGQLSDAASEKQAYANLSSYSLGAAATFAAATVAYWALVPTSKSPARSKDTAQESLPILWSFECRTDSAWLTARGAF